jgi:hypothetical protein
LQHLAVRAVGQRQLGQDAPRHSGRGGGVEEVLEQDHELVTAEPGDDVTGANGGPDPFDAGLSSRSPASCP